MLIWAIFYRQPQFRKKKKKDQATLCEPLRSQIPLPSTPILSPHFWFLGRIWGELVTIKAIASVDLYLYERAT